MAAKSPAMSPSDLSVAEVIDRVTGPRRAEAEQLLALFSEVSGEAAVVWAGRIIGFGEYHYRYASGHSGTAPLLAFASGDRQHTLYLFENFTETRPDLLAALGPHTASKVCLYLKRLKGIDLGVLRELLKITQDHARAQHIGDELGRA